MWVSALFWVTFPWKRSRLLASINVLIMVFSYPSLGLKWRLKSPWRRIPGCRTKCEYTDNSADTSICCFFFKYLYNTDFTWTIRQVSVFDAIVETWADEFILSYIHVVIETSVSVKLWFPCWHWKHQLTALTPINFCFRHFTSSMTAFC